MQKGNKVMPYGKREERIRSGQPFKQAETLMKQMLRNITKKKQEKEAQNVKR